MGVNGQRYQATYFQCEKLICFIVPVTMWPMKMLMLII